MKKSNPYKGTNVRAMTLQESMSYRRRQKIKANIYIVAVSTSFILGLISGILIDGRG